jgi:LacI family transcriptional regulator
MEIPILTADQFPLEMEKITAKVFLEHIVNTGNIKIEKKVVLTSEFNIMNIIIKKYYCLKV